ncbi:putative arsenical pump transmembrane protein [Halobacteriovorax marinus SJ]|uniref:Arsenical pump transmembrane protein n=1 Tax=Halobacteriovorax marinus (strain ATCC BAA-682 / DSM 15412 / SJ) TaxID=862908 RepID=E1X5G0_HALMS|nr:ACR3 family arsenite efflux transporter [Halobacteriovorax marinus]CBW27281.1 putative arsenical pump transmembrane protein [Halobacteriovorax marinus SJ]
MSNESEQMGFFERYLSLWVALCIVGGILLGKFLGSSISVLSELNLATVNIPVAILVWLMIFPMMVQIDFSSIKDVGRNPRGLALTLVVNWLIKPFSMAFFAWIFFDKIYGAYLTPELASEYIAGAILLGAAPCTAMVFVWSYLTKGDPEYTLVQVAINDLVLLVAFIPIVKFLLGVTSVVIPVDTLVSSVVIFVVIPLAAGFIVNKALIKTHGKDWFEQSFLPKLKPVSIIALLSTLILLFAFQGEKIIENPIHIVLIAIPLIIQTYFIFFAAWIVGKKMTLPHCILSPGSMIGASNFFELAVAVAIALFGLNSGAALVTVVGVLIEVPIMLSLVHLSNKWRY